MLNFNKHKVLCINNAGIIQNGSTENTTLDQYDTVMNINVRSMYHLTMLAVPYLIVTKCSIVNVSSVTGVRAVSNDYICICIFKNWH